MLHIAFNPSAAGGLRQALRQAGRNDRVIGLSDSLSFGPIAPPDSELRRKWVEDELGYANWEEVVGEATSFWIEACSVTDRRVAWLSRRSAQEYAGFGVLARNQSRSSISQIPECGAAKTRSVVERVLAGPRDFERKSLGDDEPRCP